ncbi:MAG TPA: EamA family transporter [Myxococcota bacterium]|nr:EamA family transporter [Myxococcota bacterium]
MTASASLLALGVGLLAAAAGQVVFKQWSQRHSHALLAGAIGLFALGQGGFFVALMGLDVGLVYMSTALSQLLVMGLSRAVFSERLDRDHAIGIGLIVAGIVLYAV